MLVNREHRKLHLAFAVPACVVACAAIAWWVSDSVSAGRWVGGGSPSGLVCGILAGLVIIFEMLLWPRKLLRRLRLVPAKYWLVAHIWFGLVSLPLAIAHCGLHLGGWLPASFMVLFVFTILSGIYGLAVQNFLPRWMLRNLPAETIYSQIDYVSKIVVEDARRALLASCGRSKRQRDQLVDAVDDLVPVAQEAIVVGAVRGAGKTFGRVLQTKKAVDATADAEPLWNTFDEIQPYLLNGRQAITPVTEPAKATQYFRTLRSVCGTESESMIDMLESYCDQRRQYDVQQTCHHWLHAWLPIHIAASVAVTVLLAAHIFTALRYW